MNKNFVTSPYKGLKGEIQVGPDKSISHRSLIFSALATGESSVKNLLLGEDVLNTLSILNQLGVKTSHKASNLNKSDELLIQGVGLKGFTLPQDVLYCGNSGTTMRLMLGVLAAQNFDCALTGDASLNKRPMERVTDPLSQMGAKFSIQYKDDKRLVCVHAVESINGIVYESPVASAQIKSSLLLAGLHAKNKTEIIEPAQSRNHTEIMLHSMGVNIKSNGTRVELVPPKTLNPIKMTVPGDISSAAFFMVGALITPDSDLLIKNLNLNPTRTGILDVLIAMGGDITIEDEWEEAGELVGNVRFCSSQLRNINIEGELIPRLIDEIPILALAASVSDGVMVLSDAKELRVKESDRITAICSQLQLMGVKITEKPDGFIIEGNAQLDTPGLPLQSFGDHRMAMMEVIAGLVLNDPVPIDDIACINTSFPEFFDILDAVKQE